MGANDSTRLLLEEGAIRAARLAHQDFEALVEHGGPPFNNVEWEQAKNQMRALGEALAALDALSELSGEPKVAEVKDGKPVRKALPWHDQPAHAVQSSNLKAARYDPAKRALEVAFRSGGVYRYGAVPAEVWASFMAAQSKGRFFQQEIRGKFTHERLDV